MSYKNNLSEHDRRKLEAAAKAISAILNGDQPVRTEVSGRAESYGLNKMTAVNYRVLLLPEENQKESELATNGEPADDGSPNNGHDYTVTVCSASSYDDAMLEVHITAEAC